MERNGLLVLLACVGIAVGLIVAAGTRKSSRGSTSSPACGKVSIAIGPPAGGRGGSGGVKVVAPVRIVLECERPFRLEDKAPDGTTTLRVVKAERAGLLGGEGYLESPDGWIKTCGQGRLKDQPGKLSGRAFYKLEIPRDGPYFVFLHARWKDNCGNSVYLRFDDGAYLVLSDTIGRSGGGSYRWAWHPVRGENGPKPFRLTRGEHVLELATKEDGPRFDQILLSTDPSKPIGGAVRGEEKAGVARQVKTKENSEKKTETEKAGVTPVAPAASTDE